MVQNWRAKLVNLLPSVSLSLSVVTSKKTKGAFKKGHDIPTQMYSRSNYTNSSASGAGNFSEPRLISQFGGMREMCAQISVFCRQMVVVSVLVCLLSSCNRGNDVGGL